MPFIKPYFISFDTVTSLGKLLPYQEIGLTRQYDPTKEVDAIVMSSGNFRELIPNTMIIIIIVNRRGKNSGSLEI